MLDEVLALTLAGLILFVLTNVFPLLGLRAQGAEQELHLFGASVAFWDQGYHLVAGLVMVTILFFPAFELLAMLTVLLTIRYRWQPQVAIFLFRWMREFKPWGMLEVFMLGVLVAVVKLGDLATLIVGTAFWSFAGVVMTMAASTALLDPFVVWRELGCPRCGGRLCWVNHANSVEVTWALLIAAIILYIPANLMPVMSVYMLGAGQPDTILGGVYHLVEAGQWPLALVVFVASIVVPLLKLCTLSFLLISIQRRSTWRQADRMRLYRITEYVGRWSMVDVFVISILTGLVQFGNLARVDANAGSFSFAAVVVLTMFAARTLDEHLIWDVSRQEGHGK
jgi:paraquat-inducible protein A